MYKFSTLLCSQGMMGTLFFFFFTPSFKLQRRELGNDFLKNVLGETTAYNIMGSHYDKRKGFPWLLQKTDSSVRVQQHFSLPSVKRYSWSAGTGGKFFCLYDDLIIIISL